MFKSKIILISFFCLKLMYPTIVYSKNLIKENIIIKLSETKNLSFNFEQTINEKTEIGNCIIKYPKKIFCLYDNFNKKILVSNGKSLVIKNQNNKQYYHYSLDRTPLNYILNKNFLINQIKNLEGRIVDNKYFNFSLKKDNNIINIFFDIETLNLIGWQTRDLYQNLSITYLSSINFNKKLNKNLFKIPERN